MFDLRNFVSYSNRTVIPLLASMAYFQKFSASINIIVHHAFSSFRLISFL